MLTPSGFLALIRDEIKKALREYTMNKEVRFGTIETGYTSGRPRIQFDGESAAGGKLYTYVSTYTPSAGDRVIVVNGVILGKII